MNFLNQMNFLYKQITEKCTSRLLKKLSVSSLLLMLTSVGLFAQTYTEPFWNQKLPNDTRIKDLMSRLTIDEKISMLLETSPGVPRLGVPKYFMGNEALHGVVRPGKFTVFPQAIGLAATWNTDLMYQITTAISDEARGRWNELQQGKLQKENYSDLLVFWSPDINLARDPRWGRTQETYGEDPFLSARMAVAFVRGLQGNDPKYLKVVATPKHYTANNEEHNRFYCNAKFSERSLREYYLYPFEYAVKEGKAQSIMSAYNAINGIPCTASKKLLTDILRTEWGFNGFVVSDCGAPGFLVTDHKYVESFEQSAVACMNAGLDLECAGYCGPDCYVYKNSLKKVFDKGLVKQSQIDSAAYRVLRARFKMGFFDRDLSTNPYNQISPSVVGSKKHQELAREAARQSIVLLKNENNVLPLNKSKVKSVAVFGPNSANCVFGGYSAKESANETVSVLQSLKKKLGDNVEINYVPWDDKNDIEIPVISKEYFHLENSNQKGLFAEYFSNKDLKGTPKTRVDEGVNFNPKQQAPDPLTPWGEKSMRWTGILTPKVSGKYTIAVNSDDGVRLYIDDKLLIDKWVVRYDTRDKINIDLVAGKEYKIKYEYFDNNGDAIAQLRWKVPGTKLEDFYSEEKQIASKSDYVIAVLGLNTAIEDEGQDKQDLNLPKSQIELIQELYKANPKTIVVLEAGSPLAISWINDHIPAIVNAWYAGEQGGNAITDVLFGDYNPAGRLPITYYKSTDDLLPFDDYEIMKGRTYMYSDKTPLYPFGYGLSYTKFEYSEVKLSKPELSQADSLYVSVKIKNTGNYEGDEVVQLYVKNKISQQPQPIKALRGFKRISLKKGETKTIQIPLKSEDLRTFDEVKNRFVVDAGTYEIQIGASCEDIRLRTPLMVKK